MTWQRTIGIDLALEGAHKAVVCTEHSQVLNRKGLSFTTDIEEMGKLITQCIPHNIKTENVAIVMEPTGNAWILVASFFIARGYRVFVVKTQKAHALRKYFKNHAKTDRIDATTLAKMPFVDQEGLNQLLLPTQRYFALERFTKERENMATMVSINKNQIYAHMQILNPKLMSLLGDNRFSTMATAFYTRYADPFVVVKDGFEKFSAYLNKKAFGTPSQDRIKNMYDTSVSIATFHKDIIAHSENNELPYDMGIIHRLIKDKLHTIKFIEKKLDTIEKEIGTLYDIIDPHKILKDLKGFGGKIIAPAIIAITGNIKRFPTMRDYVGYIGLVPNTKQSSGPAREGLKITKAGCRILKKFYYMAAETARRFDPEFANKYNLLIQKGLHHNQAICALANMLARRIYSILKQQQEAREHNDELKLKSIQYQIRDVAGKRITAQEAREICLRDYPSKKEQAKRLKEEKEKAASALGTRQSLPKDNSSKSRCLQLPPQVIKKIIPQLPEDVQELIARLA